MGWRIGTALGMVISIAVISGLGWATHNSSRFKAIARSLATHDLSRSRKLLDEFDASYTPNRFMEQPDWIVVPPLLRIVVAVGLRDPRQLTAATDAVENARDRWLSSLPAPPPSMATVGGDVYELVRSTKYTLGIRSAAMAEDWDRTIQLADEGLGHADAFWSRVEVPRVPTQPIVGDLSVANLTFLERTLRLIRAYACARSGQSERALADIETIVNEPLAMQSADYCLQPEAMVLKAAIEFQCGDLEQATATYVAAQKRYETPVDFSPPGRPERPNGVWSHPHRPDDVGQSWRLLRRDSLLSMPDWFTPGEARLLWSLKPNPRDFTDDFLDWVQKQQVAVPPTR